MTARDTVAENRASRQTSHVKDGKDDVEQAGRDQAMSDAETFGPRTIAVDSTRGQSSRHARGGGGCRRLDSWQEVKRNRESSIDSCPQMIDVSREEWWWDRLRAMVRPGPLLEAGRD